MEIPDFMDVDQRLKRTEFEILQDYVVIGDPWAGALIHREAVSAFRRGVKAAVVSAQLGISLQHAEHQYVRDAPLEGPAVPEPWAIFQRAYHLAMKHFQTTLSRFSSEGKTDPPAGVLFADAALRRLAGTFYSAGLLFRTGYLFEAHAVARMILEQVAWSYAVRNAKDIQVASKLSVTGSISVLKTLLPYVGKLYGDLSAETHLGVLEHRKFLDTSGDETRVRMTHGVESLRSGLILLDLADCWSVVYEIAQEAYMNDFENWISCDGELQLRADRPFLAEAAALNQTARDNSESQRTSGPSCGNM